ncbi:MAG: hypothetical protein J6A23_11755 [Thermoguttaceae bacterium]|nr:hypothetical protein [Thermoguttaceae bacterium]MBP3694299.1 hypothetical protein [Thermoguttaceae bacterium]
MYHAQYGLHIVRSPRTSQERRANSPIRPVDQPHDNEYTVKFRRRSLPSQYDETITGRLRSRSWKEQKRTQVEGAAVGKRMKRRKPWME